MVIGHSANSGSSWRPAEYDGETEAQPGTLAPKVLHRDVFVDWGAGKLGAQEVAADWDFVPLSP